MITLSYTTINELIAEPHTWLCKQMGLKRWVSHQMIEGKEAHRVIQNHVGGLKLDERLDSVKVRFATVEKQDQDEATHFTVNLDSKYAIHGYLDALDTDKFLEIKTSSTPWSMGQFARLMQWRVYALSNLDFTTAWFITCTRDLRRVAVYKQAVTDQDRQLALEWIYKGIKIIEGGDFTHHGTGKSRACNYIDCPYCSGGL